MKMIHTARRRREQGERGAALVEFVMVIPLLLALLIGIAEFGIAMRDWLTVTSATRAGARVGTAAGQDQQADLLILQSVESAMGIGDIDDVTQVWIFLADEDGEPSSSICGANCSLYVRSATACGWDPCPDIANGGSYPDSPWLPADRRVTITATEELDRMGVRIVFEHQWLSEFLGFGTATWRDDAVMRMEPQQFGP